MLSNLKLNSCEWNMIIILYIPWNVYHFHMARNNADIQTVQN